MSITHKHPFVIAVILIALIASVAVISIVRAQTAGDVVVAPQQVSSFFDIFIEIDGVEGESTDARHRGAIDVSSFSWGESNPSTLGGGGGGSGKVQMQDFHFTKHVDKSSPKLMVATASGEHFKKAVITVRSKGERPVEYLKYELENVLVSSYNISSGDDRPMESLSLNFTKIKMEYTEQKPDGSAGETFRGGWDLKANKKI